MKHLLLSIAASLLVLPAALADDAERIAALDTYWAEVSRSVGEGDFEGYKATCHPLGVLVSGKKQKSYALAEALAGWKVEFDDTKSGKMTASVEFRFSQRLGDAKTAHETGIFLYKNSGGDGEPTEAYINFEALLVKGDGGKWQIMMEYQKSETTKAEWDALSGK